MNVSEQLKLYIYCSMNKEYEEGVQKWEKADLMSVLATWLCSSLARSQTMFLLFKEQKQKKNENGFLTVL